MIFQPVFKYFKARTNSDRVTAWKSKDFPKETIKSPATSSNSLNPTLNYTDNLRMRVKVAGSCLKQDKVTFTPRAKLNFCIDYEINLWSYYLVADFALKNDLFGAFKLTKNAKPNKYSYSGYGFQFDAFETFLVKWFLVW